jgi:hypothetical protein
MNVSVNVYDGNGKVIARVNYNDNLDNWDGHNWSCGANGRHLGITKLKKSGQYVLIHGTQWQGEGNTSEIITHEEAFQVILRNGHSELLEKFPDLKKYIGELDSDSD